jgi:hypothetical protein
MFAPTQPFEEPHEREMGEGRRMVGEERRDLLRNSHNPLVSNSPPKGAFM